MCTMFRVPAKRRPMRCSRAAQARRRGCRIPAGIDGTMKTKRRRHILCHPLLAECSAGEGERRQSFLLGEFAMNRNVFVRPLLAGCSAGESEPRESFLLGDLTMNRVVFLLQWLCWYLDCWSPVSPATTISDDFSARPTTTWGAWPGPSGTAR